MSHARPSFSAYNPPAVIRHIGVGCISGRLVGLAAGAVPCLWLNQGELAHIKDAVVRWVSLVAVSLASWALCRLSWWIRLRTVTPRGNTGKD